MSFLWIPVAVIAQTILGTSAVFDKFLLSRPHINPLSYSFWIGILGVFAIAFIPFGFYIPPFSIILIAFVSGASLVAGMFFLYKALKLGDTAGTFLLFGAFTPVFTLALGGILLQSVLNAFDLFGFALLVLGGIILFGIEKKDLRLSIFCLSVAGSFFLAVSSAEAKLVFNEISFVNGFIWIKSGGVFVALLSLLVPGVRKKIAESARSTIKNRFLYFGNRLYSGIGSVLFSLSISLSHPALIEATGSLKYAVIFVAAWYFLGEKFSGKILFGKIFATFLIVSGLAVLSFGELITAPL